MPQRLVVYGPSPVPRWLSSADEPGSLRWSLGGHIVWAGQPWPLSCSNLFTLCWNAATSVIKPGLFWTPPQSLHLQLSSAKPELGKKWVFNWSASPFSLIFEPLLGFPVKSLRRYLSHPWIPFPVFYGRQQRLSASSEHLLRHKDICRGSRTDMPFPCRGSPSPPPELPLSSVSILTVTLLLLPKCNMNPGAALLNYNLGQQCLVGWKVMLKPHLF